MKGEQAARLIRELQQRPDHMARRACGYGSHDFTYDDPAPGYKHCGRCDATYIHDAERAFEYAQQRHAEETGGQT